MKPIEKIKYFAYKILPLVYDDSLSYYEVLAKVTAKMNELISNNNVLPETIAGIINSDDVATNLWNELANGITVNEGTNEYTPDDKQGGEVIWINDKLYVVTKPMKEGTRYIEGTNIEITNVEDQISWIKGAIICGNTEFYRERSSKSYSVGEYLIWKDGLYRVTSDISVDEILSDAGDRANLHITNITTEIKQNFDNFNPRIASAEADIDKNTEDIAANANRIENVNTSLNGRINNIIAQSGTSDTEVVDARKLSSYKFDQKTLSTLKQALDYVQNNSPTSIAGYLKNIDQIIKMPMSCYARFNNVELTYDSVTTVESGSVLCFRGNDTLQNGTHEWELSYKKYLIITDSIKLLFGCGDGNSISLRKVTHIDPKEEANLQIKSHPIIGYPNNNTAKLFGKPSGYFDDDTATVDFYELDKRYTNFLVNNQQKKITGYVKADNDISFVCGTAYANGYLSAIITDLVGNLFIYTNRKGIGSEVIKQINFDNINEFITSTSKRLNSIESTIANLNPLNFKYIAMGDSITALGGSRGWTTYFNEITNGELIANTAVNSAVLPDYENTVYDGNPQQSNQNNNTLGNQVQKILNNNYEEPDIIIIAIGTNGGININQSQMEEVYYDESYNIKPLENVDKTTHAGAFRYAFDTLHNKYPNAIIIWCSPIYGCLKLKRPNDIINWNNSLKIATQFVGTHYIDNTRCGINFINETQGENGEYLIDGLHPNTKGAKMLGNNIANQVLAMYRGSLESE